MNVQIIPKKLRGTVTAPASKSAAHRMLICAALGNGKSIIKINGISEDIKATINCLRSMGAEIKTDGDYLTVVSVRNSPEKAVFDCKESGSTLRFLLPVAAALGIDGAFKGNERLFERPVKNLLLSLENHGINCGRGYPVTINGKLTGGRFSVDGSISSQFATGLLLALPLVGGSLELTGDIVSESYINMTVDIMKKFGIEFEKNNNIFEIKKQKYSSGNFSVESDWSNGAYFLAAGVNVENLEENSLQGDRIIPEILKNLPCEVDASHIPDSVPLIAVMAATKKGETVIKNVDRLRFKESDRVLSTVQLVNSLGGKAKKEENKIIITGTGELKGGMVESFNDHRIVMAGAVAAQFCSDNVIIKDAHAVNKSYPDFFNVYKSLGGEINVIQLR